MKGILYGNFLLNRKWFIWAGAAAVLGTAACAVLLSVLGGDPENMGLVGNTFILMQVVVMALCEEWLGRNLEANIKCRFTDYTLAGGISKNMFVLSELVKNMITMLIGLVMCLAMLGVMCLFDSSFCDSGFVEFLIIAALFIGAVDWAMLPLVVKLKSAEKAGMVIGLIVGFGIIFPVILAFRITNNGEITMLPELINKVIGSKWFFPACIGICAALYAVFYAVMLHRVKRGDVC